MSKATENLTIRDKRIADVNKWILKEGYQIITHHEDGKTVLGLYKPAPSKNYIPEFLKDLVKGDNNTVNTFVNGMHAALNLVP